MKKILLLGDSIMYGVGRLRGYGAFLREKLEGKASVYLPTENCQDIRYLRAYHEELIPALDGEYDVIHWNNGLWDLLHFGGNPMPHTPLELYTKNLAETADILHGRYPRASVFFATSTPILEHVRKGSSYRLNAEIEAYNAAAVETLRGEVAGFDDLYRFASSFGDRYRSKDGLHYSEEGARLLADAVCAFLLKNAF